MKVSDLMKNITPNPAFEGFATADDMVLAIDFTGKATNPNDFIVAQFGITEQSGSLEAQTQEGQYLRTGKVTTKTGTSRSFSISGDRYHKDEFQEKMLAHEMKFGTGQDVIRPYVYFNRLTGKGEQGKVAITIEDDLSGAAGDNASFSASLTSTMQPLEYTYAPTK